MKSFVIKSCLASDKAKKQFESLIVVKIIQNQVDMCKVGGILWNDICFDSNYLFHNEKYYNGLTELKKFLEANTSGDNDNVVILQQNIQVYPIQEFIKKISGIQSSVIGGVE